MTAFKPTLISFTVLFLLVQSITAQPSEEATSGSKATIEPRYLYNLPTAGVLRRGAYSVEGWFFAGGGAMSTVSVGLAERFTFGISYGAGNLIGSGNPNWNPLPGVMARYRLIDEELQTPAVTIGFESQGRGNFIRGVDRYERKSPGFFVAATKNFEFLGFLALTSGLNYSLERKDDGGLNFYIGNSPGADGTYQRLPGITPSIVGQTRDAMALAELGRDKGEEVFWPLHLDIFREYFVHGRDIGDREVLAAVGEKHGFDRGEMDEVWDTGRYDERLHQFRHLALHLGIRETPSALICNELLIGSRPYAVIREAVQRCLVRPETIEQAD